MSSTRRMTGVQAGAEADIENNGKTASGPAESLLRILSFGISPALGEATATFPGCHIFGRWLRARGPGYSVALLYEHGDRRVCLGGSGGTPAVGWRAAGCFRASAASCALRPVCLPLSGHRSVPLARGSRPRGLGCSARHRAPLRGFI